MLDFGLFFPFSELYRRLKQAPAADLKSKSRLTAAIAVITR
jgi:hypothetical protein